MTPSANEYELVMLISKNQGESDIHGKGQEPCCCRLVNVPKTVTSINHLPVARLREILHHHGFPVLGSMDQLAIRVYLLRNGQTAAINALEEE